jgi:hypothetical protein
MLATWVPEKAKKRNMVVPTNSPTKATKSGSWCKSIADGKGGERKTYGSWHYFPSRSPTAISSRSQEAADEVVRDRCSRLAYLDDDGCIRLRWDSTSRSSVCQAYRHMRGAYSYLRCSVATVRIASFGPCSCYTRLVEVDVVAGDDDGIAVVPRLLRSNLLHMDLGAWRDCKGPDATHWMFFGACWVCSIRLGRIGRPSSWTMACGSTPGRCSGAGARLVTRSPYGSRDGLDVVG